MPVFGLPCAVEGALNNLISAGQITTWRIQGQGNATTLTLKFRENEEGAMADQPKNVYYKKKSRRQIKRDQKRTEEYHSSQDQRKEPAEDMEKEKEETLTESVQACESEVSTNRPIEVAVIEEKKQSTTAPTETVFDTTTQQANEPSHQAAQNSVRPSLTPLLKTKAEERKTQSQHSDTPVRPTFTASISTSELENRLTERNYNPKIVSNQLDCKSIRMKKLFISPNRNNKFEYICSVNHSGDSEDIVAETDDFLFCCQTEGEKKKLFIVKNASMYRDIQEELLLESVRTQPPIDQEKFKTKLDEMKTDLCVLTEFARNHLSYAEHYDM